MNEIYHENTQMTTIFSLILVPSVAFLAILRRSAVVVMFPGVRPLCPKTVCMYVLN